MKDSFDLVISLEHRVPLERGWDDIIQHYRARIVRRRSEQEWAAGVLEFYVVNVSLAFQRGANIVDIADSVDKDLFNYCECLFKWGTGAEFHEEVAEQFEYPTGGRVLILHLAKVLPEYRGRNLGLVAARRIVEQFGDGLVILMAQPLQHHSGFSQEKEMRYEAFEKREAAAMKRLKRHWGRLGFTRIGTSDYLGLSTEHKLPEIKLLSKIPATRVKQKPKRRG